MSIYKVINNYYDDFLLYLKRESNNNNGLENMFKNITNDKKKEIIVNLSNMILKFDTIYNIEVNYLLNNKKQQKWFIAIYVITLLIVTIIIIIVFIFANRYNKRIGKTSIIDFGKTAFTFIIIFEVILLFFIIVLVNVVSQLKLSTGQLELLNNNFHNFSKYIFRGTTHDDFSLIRFFTFLGYYRKSDKTRSKKFYDLLMLNDPSIKNLADNTDPNNSINIMSQFKVTGGISSDNTTSVSGSSVDNLSKAYKDSLNTGLNSLLSNTNKEVVQEKSANDPLLVQIYNSLSNDIQTALITFYNNGNGFSDVKKMMLLDNPTALLKESRNIMDFYYSISLQKYNPPTTQDIETQKNENDDIIHKEFINPMISLLNTFNINNVKPDDKDIKNSISNNLNDPDFNNSHTRLLTTFFYLIIFVYPIYINVSDIDNNFPIPKILIYMPNNLDINSENSTAITKDYLEAVNIAFSTIYNNKYQKYFTNNNTIENFTDDMTPQEEELQQELESQINSADEKEKKNNNAILQELKKTIPLSNEIIQQQQNKTQQPLWPVNINSDFTASINNAVVNTEFELPTEIESEFPTENESTVNTEETNQEISTESISLSKNIYVNNQSFIIEVFKNIIPLFQELYYNLFIYLNGYSFPFDHDYITNAISDFLENNITSLLPKDYKTKIIELIYDTIITKIKKDFDIFKIKQGYFIDLVSTNLVPYKNIDIIEYQSYIVNYLLEINSQYDMYTKDVIDMTTNIQKKILIKRQLTNDNTNKGSLFVTNETFIKILDNITYNDLIQGLNVVFYQDIISKFYKKISESVNIGDKNLQNIYYQKWKNIKILKIIVTMVIIIMITALLKYLLKILNERVYIPEAIRECDRLGVNREFKSTVINGIIKTLVPVMLLLLIIAMLVSYYQKVKSKLEFNIEIIENNSNDLSNELLDFNEYLIKLDTQFTPVEKKQSIDILTKFNKEQKLQIFEYIKVIVDKFDKCNYIVEASGRMPFPYSEVFTNVFVLIICICVIFIVLIRFNPVKCMRDIRYLNKLIEELSVTRNLNEFTIKLMSLSVCHYENIDAIAVLIKAIFGVFVFMFLLYYSVLVFSSASQFKNGLYNSKYFEDGQCYK